LLPKRDATKGHQLKEPIENQITYLKEIDEFEVEVWIRWQRCNVTINITFKIIQNYFFG